MLTESRWITQKTLTQKWICDRTRFTPELEILLNNPDQAFTCATKTIFQEGETNDLCMIICNNHHIVVKRYNLKGLWHQVKRFFSRSRAERSWKNAHQLLNWGINTPKPIAYSEYRFGVFRRTAFYIADYVEGQCLCDSLPNLPPTTQQAIASQCIQLLTMLHRHHVVHGDMKCTNLLVANNKLYLLDLDAMHVPVFQKSRKIKKDCWRLLKNWQNHPELYNIFDKLIKQHYKPHCKL